MIGKTFGHYRVGEQLGRGGMGEVYVADDLNLNRKVALKFLPEAFTGDPERMARFEREAKLLASLNHPNIAAIYGLEQAEGKRFLVLELVQGETLAQRISKGALPVDEAVAICRQIAEGLEAAHEKGVIHRDLKPANVMITEGDSVKILDFGLAKALSDETQSVDSSHSPTLTEAMTRPGVILGTAAYMSPEQAKGKSVDKRADIWAFGCTLYECLIGKRAFEGETVTETLAAILKGEPDWSLLPANTPPYVRRLLQRCLEKDERLRLRDIGEARVALAKPEATPPAVEIPSPRRRREILAWVGAAVLFVAAAILALARLWENPTDSTVDAIPMRFSVQTPSTDNYFGLSVSPDGRYLAFQGFNEEGSQTIWIRPVDSFAARELPGTEGTGYTLPFWSADSRSIAYVMGQQLRKVDISGGTPQILCELVGTESTSGGAWNRDGAILFPGADGLYRVSAAGGVPSRVTALDSARQEISHSFPQFLPDGRHFLYLIRNARPENNAVYAGSLDSKENVRLLAIDSKTMFTSPGYLVFASRGALMAQRFDASALKMQGEAVRITGQVHAYGALAAYCVSDNGILSYRGGDMPRIRFQWRDRAGKPAGEIGKAGPFGSFDLSPDAARLVVEGQSGGLYLIDVLRNVTSALSLANGTEAMDPIWSADGRYIAFDRASRNQIARIPANGGTETILSEGNPRISGPWSEDWSKDGRFLLTEQGSFAATDIMALPTAEGSKPITILKGAINADEPHFSPDGKWVAYNSEESGRQEVYVVPFPPTGARWQVSTSGGVQARWRGDGKELYYLTLQGKLMAADIKPGASFDWGVPRSLFETGLSSVRFNIDQYAVTSDGSRFVVQVPETGEEATLPINVVLNWTSLLKK